MIIDSHCHLNMHDFTHDIEHVVKRAKDSNVQYLQTICTKLSDMDDILRITSRFQNIFASVGIHPHEVDKYDDIYSIYDKVIAFTDHPKIISIGETGLDYYYSHSIHENQKAAFAAHISVSQNTGLPLIVHTRLADDDTIDILTQKMKEEEFSGLIHCFSSSMDLANKCIDLGMYISVSGIITFKKADDLREIIANIPLERLLVETDSPYLAPHPMRGQRNEPAFTNIVVDQISKIKNIKPETVAEQTTRNFWKLFTKASDVSQL